MSPSSFLQEYQYFAHLTHGQKMIPYNQWTPLAEFDYAPYEKNRIEKLYFSDLANQYIKNKHTVELGSNNGFFSYLCSRLGAQSVKGLEVRKNLVDIAEYAFDQLGESNYKFYNDTLENFSQVQTICDGADTVILTQVLEHARNPEMIMRVISESTVQNLIFESVVSPDLGFPMLKYFLQNTKHNWACSDNNKMYALGALPNRPWIDTILHYHGWRVQYYHTDEFFDLNFYDFAETDIPELINTVTILATKR
jgi:hypothetical protein